MAYGDSAADSLSAVRSAIRDVLFSQAYTTRERMNKRAALADLRKTEKELQQEAQVSTRMLMKGRIKYPL